MEAPGENLIIKMWDSLVDKGIGSLLKPWQIRREAKAITESEAENMVTIALAEKTVEEIKQGKYVHKHKALPLAQKYLERQEIDITPESLTKLAAKLNYDEILRTEINTAKAILVAESILKDETQQPTEESIDQDWLYRWRDYAGGVSSEELQIIWGKLLAGEIKSPGKFSLRTLEFIKNLSTYEALKIENLLGFITNTLLFKGKNKILNSFDIELIDLLEFQDWGLITGVETTGGLTMNQKVSSTEPYILRSNNFALLVSSDKPKEIILPSYPVTNLGRQLCELCKPTPNVSFLKKMGQEIKGMGYRVQLISINLDLSTDEEVEVDSIEEI